MKAKRKENKIYILFHINHRRIQYFFKPYINLGSTDSFSVLNDMDLLVESQQKPV